MWTSMSAAAPQPYLHCTTTANRPAAARVCRRVWILPLAPKPSRTASTPRRSAPKKNSRSFSYAGTRHSGSSVGRSAPTPAADIKQATRHAGSSSSVRLPSSEPTPATNVTQAAAARQWEASQQGSPPCGRCRRKESKISKKSRPKAA